MGSGRGRSRGGRGRGGSGGSHGGQGGRAGPLQPVDFYLYASQQFPLDGCPAQISQPKDPQALRRLSMPDRATLGDILCWFAATAIQEPSARLVMFQATNQDKSWLASFAAETLPQILIDTVELRPNNRCTQYSLDPRLVPAQLPPELLAQAEAAAAPPPPPPPAQQQQQHASVAPTVRPSTPPAAGEQHTRVSPEESADKAALSTQAASAADSKRDEPVVQEAAASGQASSAVQKTIAAAEAAASKAGSAVSCAATQVKDAAQAAVHKAEEVVEGAAAAVRKNGEVAKAQVNGVAAIAAGEAAISGDSGPGVQTLAIGGAAAAAVAIVGVVLGLVFGGKKRTR